MSMKRKANGALATLSPASKRSRKTDNPSAEVTTKGLEFLEILRQTRDKSNRLIASRFEQLPDRKKEPEYYEIVLLPLSLETIQAKLERGAYPTMTTLESDFKRMITNYKDVYDRASEAHKDAEKVRKVLNTHMKEHHLNPQYDTDPNYVAFPTPIPGEDDATIDADAKQATFTKEERPRGRIVLRRSLPQPPVEAAEDEERDTKQAVPRLRLRAPRRSSAAADEEAVIIEDESKDVENVSEQPKRGKLILRRPTATAAVTATATPIPEVKKPPPRRSSPAIKIPPEASEGFEKKSMTEAQEKILNEMENLEDEDGYSIAGPFINLPSRDLKDYYATIKNPLSIKGAQKLVKGIQGREKVTGVTFLKTWQDFEDRVSLIWTNARFYNEDESDISKLATKLEKYFKSRVEEAKKVVPDPVAPKIKLQADKPVETPAKPSPTPVPAPANTPGVVPNKYAVDQDALLRQKQMVANGVVGRVNSTDPSGTSPAPQVTPSTKPGLPQTPATYHGHPSANGVQYQASGMLPPHTAPRPPQPTIARPPPPPPSEEVKKPWDSWLRSERPEAFHWPYHTIKEILIVSHPSLKLESAAYKWALYPWKQFNYASDTIPMSKDTTRILLSPLLIKSTRERPVVYHHVTLNGTRLQASSSAPRITGGQASEEDNLYRPVYDIHLNGNDVNEIMVECYTCPAEVCETKDVLFDKHIINIQPR